MLDGPDPLLELFLRAEEDALKDRRKLEKRAEYGERHKQRRAGHYGPFTCRLAVPRCVWPTVHTYAREEAVRLATDVLPPGVTTPIVISTTESGAAVLCQAAPDVSLLPKEATT